MERIAFEEPRTVETEMSSQNRIYIPASEDGISCLAAGVFEINEVPMVLKRDQSRLFRIPEYVRKLLDIDAGDRVEVRILGGLKGKIEDNGLKSEK